VALAPFGDVERLFPGLVPRRPHAEQVRPRIDHQGSAERGRGNRTTVELDHDARVRADAVEDQGTEPGLEPLDLARRLGDRLAEQARRVGRQLLPPEGAPCLGRDHEMTEARLATRDVLKVHGGVVQRLGLAEQRQGALAVAAVGEIHAVDGEAARAGAELGLILGACARAREKASRERKGAKDGRADVAAGRARKPSFEGHAA
jgi:hypothetical protein